MGTDVAQDHVVDFYEIQAGLKMFGHVIHQRGLQDCSDFLNPHSCTSLMLSEKAWFGKLSARNLSVQKNELELLSIGCLQWPIQVKYISILENMFQFLKKTFHFQKTHFIFRKHTSISENTFQFLKTDFNFRKHISLSENLFQFLKTDFNFRK